MKKKILDAGKIFVIVLAVILAVTATLTVYGKLAVFVSGYLFAGQYIMEFCAFTGVFASLVLATYGAVYVLLFNDEADV